MMRRNPPTGNARRGSAMVEFALTFLLFLALMLGGLELGRAIWTYSTVSYAAKQAVRYAMIHGADNAGIDQGGNPRSQTDVGTSVESIAKSNAVGLQSDSIDVTTTWTPDNSPGSAVKVRVSYPFATLFQVLTGGSGDLGIASEYTMIVTN
jgi:Flp pilus assembly protein TadG